MVSYVRDSQGVPISLHVPTLQYRGAALDVSGGRFAWAPNAGFNAPCDRGRKRRGAGDRHLRQFRQGARSGAWRRFQHVVGSGRGTLRPELTRHRACQRCCRGGF
jgi:hypothetical protein